MNKPWDNESTAETEHACLIHTDDVVDADFARNLERRLRHTEMLLLRANRIVGVFDDDGNDMIVTYLNAASEEDQR